MQMTNLKTSSSITPYRLEQPLGDDDDFSDFPLRGPPLSNIIALTAKELDRNAVGKYIKGSEPGQIVLRFGVDDARAVVSFDFISFGVDTYFTIYEPARGTERGDYLDTITKRPSKAEADWQTGADGRRHWLYEDGREIKETIIVYMVVDGRVIAFRARSSALQSTRDLLNRATRMSIEEDGEVKNKLFHGPLISKWRMTTLEHLKPHRYWTPVPTLLGKLGQEGGPSFEEYLFAKQARESFRQSGVLLDEAPAIAPPGPPAPTLAIERGSQTVTTGKQPRDYASRRDEAPPPASADGYGGRETLDDDISF
jgi:hypothetical protein